LIKHHTKKESADKRRNGTVSGHRGIMSDALKAEIAKELGVYNTVSSEGWGSVTSRDCGNIVKKAIEIAERNINR
jgi:small acid-soluble spore protein F (minor alpha/beta-type SASP)